MRRRSNRAHLILTSVVTLVLMLLIVDGDVQAQIAFASERDGNKEIYVMDADGKNLRRLTTNGHEDWDPSWSPDGERIAFTSSRKVVEGRRQIYVMDADGGNQRRLTNNPFAEWHPSWSPDGKRIAFTSDVDWHTHIYVMDANGKNLRRLGQHEDTGRYPSWSPDGKRIAFASYRDGHLGGAFGIAAEIYVMDADGKNQQRLTENPAHDWEPSWSPDGEHIAFVSDRDGNPEIYVMDADGGNQQRLTRNPAHDRSPSWSPDVELIAFMSHRDGNWEIYVMNADGARQVRRRTKDGGEDTNPAWFAPAFAFAVGPAGKQFTMWGWLKQVNR